MTEKEFTQYVRELQNFYGQELSEKETEMWFKNLSFMSIERFNYILEEIYKTNKYMPKLSEILEIHKSIPYKEQQVKVKGNCNKCNNTGYLLYTKVINGMNYTYACVCDCGRQKRYDGRQVQDIKNKSEFYISKLEEIGIDIKTNKEIDPQRIVKSMNLLNKTNIVSEEIKDLLRRKYIELTRK